MSSPGQKRGGCGHAMANFDQHTFCARCHEKNKGEDPCVENKDQDCKFCLALTPKQLAQISTPSYKIKREKWEARKVDNATPIKTSDELDPATVSVIGVVGQQETPKSQLSVFAPPQKKLKKSASITKAKKATGKSSDPSTTDSKIPELDQKWSERFNRLEAPLLAKTLQQPTFSSDIRVNPPRSPPASIPRDSEPFFHPTGCTGKDSSAEIHQSASQPDPDINTSPKRTGIGSSAFIASTGQPA